MLFDIRANTHSNFLCTFLCMLFVNCNYFGFFYFLHAFTNCYLHKKVSWIPFFLHRYVKWTQNTREAKSLVHYLLFTYLNSWAKRRHLGKSYIYIANRNNETLDSILLTLNTEKITRKKRNKVYLRKKLTRFCCVWIPFTRKLRGTSW